MEDLISVIVTVYNDEKYLRNCILSIISQSYRNMEIIIIDDGSTDDSAKICNDLIITNSKMKVVHQLHSGTAVARNKGVELASGNYITFVNGCDTLDSNLLEDLHDMMNNYMVDVSMCSTYTKLEEKNPKNETDTVITLEIEDTLRQFLVGKTITSTPCAKLFKRNLFKAINFVENEADTTYKLIENSTNKVAFKNKAEYFMQRKESYSFTSLINKDLRIMKLYPELAIYCKCNIVKSIQNEFYDSIINNQPLVDEQKIYEMFSKIVKDNDTDIDPFLSYTRKAHMYLLQSNLKDYKILCPVLPEIYKDDNNI